MTRDHRPAAEAGDTLDSALRAAAARGPARGAVVHRDVRLSYGDLIGRVDALASALGSRGVERGARVALLLADGPHYIEALFALSALGAVAVPIDGRFPPDEVARIVADADASLLLAHHRVLATTAIGEARGVTCDIVAADDDQRQPFADVAGLSRPGQPAPRAPRSAPSDPAAIFYTAGTSGHAVGVVHTHASLLRTRHVVELSLRRSLTPGLSPRRTARQLALYKKIGRRLVRAARNPVVMIPTALQNISGHTTLGLTLVRGGRLVLPDGFHPRRTLELIERERVTNLGFTPMMADLVTRVKRREHDLSSLLTVMLGGELSSPALVRRVREYFDCAVGIGYGTTELGGPVVMTRLDDPEPLQSETVGRPLDGVTVRVVGSAGDAMAPGSVGELHVRAAPIMSGYWRRPDLDALAFAPGGFFRTGDLASIGSDGAVRVLGRAADVVEREGGPAYVGEIERALELVPGVREAAAVGIPAPGGTRIVAFTVAEPGIDLTIEGLDAASRSGLPERTRPDEFRVRAHLPRTPDGKIQRALLRQEAGAGSQAGP